MARRQSRSASIAVLLIAGVLVLAGFAAWKYSPGFAAFLSSGGKPSEPARAPVSAAFDVCALATAEATAFAFAGADSQPRHIGAAADIPAAGACTWGSAERSVVATVFTPASLRGGKAPGDPHRYYESVVTGFEYALKSMPRPIGALGDEAAAAGFESGEGQIVMRKGDRVMHLAARGIPRPQAEQFARALAANL